MSVSEAHELEDRRKAFEAQFALQLEQEFLARIERVRALGRWAADAMGYSAEASRVYVSGLVDRMIAHGPVRGVIDQIQSDFTTRGLHTAPHHLRKRASALLL